jgi:imidazolonepropionase-like amidohydrolase
VSDAAQADAVVAAQLARGVTFIKLYENLPLATYDALILSASARGARIAGHVSAFVDVRHAMESQDSIEHLNGYERAVSLVPNAVANDIGAWQNVDRTRYRALAELSATKGVWNCPTLYVYAVLSNRSTSVIENRRAFVRELHDAGARLVAGTDAGYLVPAGSALLEELRELVASGLTNYEALSAATRDAAEFLHLGDEIGTIEKGKRADLLLLADSPLEDLDALRSPIQVILAGDPLFDGRRRSANH